MTKEETVFVGMSGGVDSSVTALRLKKQGYNVVGVFIKVWHPDFMVCNWEEERLDAMRVAAHLGLPFMTCDAEEMYKDGVAEYFINEYRAGRTPNPDVMCNKKIKFGAFYDFAKAHNATYIATGHYVQKQIVNGKGALHRGVDTQKDQSYFLWSLSQSQLDYALFPVGDTKKSVIRQEALRARLPVAKKPDSQGICFLGHVDIPDFLSHYIDLQPGPVVNTEGTIIGEHRGALVYTVGQRHGFSISNITTEQAPHYVISKDVEKNTITVATKKPYIESTNRISLTDVVLRDTINPNVPLVAQFRYRQTPFEVSLKLLSETTADVFVKESTERPSSGQSCVLYQGTQCLGGGIIA
jgi:tRNA-specific 2-thiouridylase